ncbi:MAG: hypothetical protein ACTSRR_01815 [Candidatus Heimdallarchaeaceae archaeon]
MSLKRILKRKKTILGTRKQKFNPLYKFDFQGIISDSRNDEKPFFGSELSDTLFFEGEEKLKDFAFLFLEESCEFYPSLTRRIKKCNSLLLANEEILNKYENKNHSIRLPSRDIINSTFSLGKKWFRENQFEVLQKIENVTGNSSIIFIFAGNDGFLFGLLMDLLPIIKKKGKTPIVILEKPLRKQDLNAEVSFLSFISYLINLENTLIPFILLDHNKLIENNPSNDYLELKNKFRDRVINIIIDITTASISKNDFYSYDLSDFLYIFQEAKGLCSLVAYDIYEQINDFTVLLKVENLASSIEIDNPPLRGFISIQTTDEGLSVANYKVFRQKYSNKDVFFAINGDKRRGTIIRGIFSFVSIPQEIVDSFNILNNIIVKEYNSDGELIGASILSSCDSLFEKEYYLIEENISKEDEEEKKSR